MQTQNSALTYLLKKNAIYAIQFMNSTLRESLFDVILGCLYLAHCHCFVHIATLSLFCTYCNLASVLFTWANSTWPSKMNCRWEFPPCLRGLTRSISFLPMLLLDLKNTWLQSVRRFKQKQVLRIWEQGITKYIRKRNS